MIKVLRQRFNPNSKKRMLNMRNLIQRNDYERNP